MKINAYSCGSSIREPVMLRLCAGASIEGLNPDDNPQYESGHSVVWGLIRGATNIMRETLKANFDFYQVDNAYFGRELFFRVTKNNTQLTSCPDRIVNNRYIQIFNSLGLNIEPWKRVRNGPIVICPQSEFFHHLNGTSVRAWVAETTARVRRLTDREIVVREKGDAQKNSIDSLIFDAWCVITHSSSSGLDALRLGIPVIALGGCAASPLSTPLDMIECPILADGRHELFSLLACGQFSQEELSSYNVLKVADRIFSQLN